MDPDVQLAAAGDMVAFERLYRAYYRRVYSRCFRMTRSVSESEDLTQDIFVHLFRTLKTFRGESSFTTWLHRLTVNAVLMHFRKQARRREQTGVDVETAFESVKTGSRMKSSPLDRVALDEGIKQLAPGYRAVLILHDIEGYEHKEIARILKCSEGTSKSQLHKARMRLRNWLTKKRAASDDCNDSSIQQFGVSPQLSPC
jgi:RNA polymerase sigma-70 factor (ECF subfamily)